jgi:hypothetical protein
MKTPCQDMCTSEPCMRVSETCNLPQRYTHTHTLCVTQRQYTTCSMPPAIVLLSPLGTGCKRNTVHLRLSRTQAVSCQKCM